jgi:hypothetical protein
MVARFQKAFPEFPFGTRRGSHAFTLRVYCPAAARLDSVGKVFRRFMA